MVQRPVLVHIHLFKNAGTSVERSLHHYFGDRWVSHDPTDSGGRFGQQELERLLIERPDIAAVSSHQVRPPIVDTEHVRFLPIVFLRHPLDRIRSAYAFERTQGGVSPSSRAAESSSFAEWIDFHRRRGSTQCANFQTYALSSLRAAENHAPLLKLPIRDHLNDALGFVERQPLVVGVVEDYERSWSALTAMIATHVPGFDAPALWANATDQRKGGLDLAGRLESIQAQLGGDEHDRLLGENDADLELHREVTERLSSG